MEYKFYGWKTADVPPVSGDFPGIDNPRRLYDYLSDLWCAETCAPRLRPEWSPENRTLGQCSITAFLAQDIFGGEVRGILLPDGAYHCYNVVGSCIFDLASEQFGDTVLSYDDNPIQTREEHFASADKFRRYQMLKTLLLNRLL